MKGDRLFYFYIKNESEKMKRRNKKMKKRRARMSENEIKLYNSHHGKWNYHEEEDSLKRVLAKDPSFMNSHGVSARRLLAELYERFGEYKKAIYNYALAIRFFPEDALCQAGIERCKIQLLRN